MDRRTLVHWMLATGGLAALQRLSERDLLTLGGDAHRRAHHPSPDGTARDTDARTTLDARAAAIVTAAAEQIIPTSDTPGATQAGVTAFIDTMLGEWYPVADRDRFLAGLQALDAHAQRTAGQPFVGCGAAAHVTMLTHFDDEVTALRAAGSTAANDHWFAMLKYLTVWGYCTSEVGMRETLRTFPMPMRYDGNAPVAR